MLEKIINILKIEILPSKYTFIPYKYVFIFLGFMFITFVVGFGYLLSRNTVKLDIPEITDKLKGKYIDVSIPDYFFLNKDPGTTYNPDNFTLTLLPNNKVLYLSGYRAIVFDFDKKIAYANYYFPFLEYPLGSPKFFQGATTKPLVLPDGKVYLFGDYKGSEVFDSKSNKFYPIASMYVNRYRSYKTATFLPNKKILIAGGYFLEKMVLSEAELYDPQLNKYTAILTMNAKRAGHTATLLNNGMVLLVGGNTPNEPYAELFDYKTNKFYPIENDHKTRSHHTANLLPDGRVLIIGGDDGSLNWPDNMYSDVEIFDPKTNNFKELSHLIGKCHYHYSLLLKSNKVFISSESYCPYGGKTYAILYDLKTKHSARVLGDEIYSGTPAIKLNDDKVVIVIGYQLKLYIP